MAELNQYDNEALELMIGLLGKGFMIFPIDPELKAKFYKECEVNGRNPHELIREDMGKRIVILQKRRDKALQEQLAKQASFLARSADQARKEKNTTQDISRKRKDD